MKKLITAILSVVLAGSMVLGLAACGNKDNGKTDDKGNVENSGTNGNENTEGEENTEDGENNEGEEGNQNTESDEEIAAKIVDTYKFVSITVYDGEESTTIAAGEDGLTEDTYVFTVYDNGTFDIVSEELSMNLSGLWAVQDGNIFMALDIEDTDITTAEYNEGTLSIGTPAYGLVAVFAKAE